MATSSSAGTGSSSGSNNDGNTARRRKSSSGTVSLKGDESLCTFCQEKPAAVTIKIPFNNDGARGIVGKSSKTQTQLFRRQSYCLLHYYTTRAVRIAANEEDVTVVDQVEFLKQLGPMQELFSEAFVQLQQSLSEESARAFAAQQHDPLAILHNLSRRSSSSTTSKRKRKAPPAGSLQDKRAGSSSSGGFLRASALPERLLRTQQEQARAQQAMTKRMEQAAATAAAARNNAKPDLSRRRKTSRKSIWNSVLEDDDDDKDRKKKPPPGSVGKKAAPPSVSFLDQNNAHHDTTCGCGSDQVEIVFTSSSRHGDMPKAETWGSKDRQVVTRYRCLSCGKTWNEED